MYDEYVYTDYGVVVDGVEYATDTEATEASEEEENEDEPEE